MYSLLDFCLFSRSFQTLPKEKLESSVVLRKRNVRLVRLYDSHYSSCSFIDVLFSRIFKQLQNGGHFIRFSEV
jgi:hypothetical protein